MNALPIKTGSSPKDVLDNLIADFGVWPVFSAFVTRLFQRRPSVESKSFPGLKDQPGLDQLDDHLRADLGLPPKPDRGAFVDPIVLLRKDFF